MNLNLNHRSTIVCEHGVVKHEMNEMKQVMALEKCKLCFTHPTVTIFQDPPIPGG